MILFIAEKDKEKKSHLPCTRHELAVIVKEVTSVNYRTVENKQVKVHAQNYKSTGYCIELNFKDASLVVFLCFHDVSYCL